MSYEFRRLADVPAVEELTDQDHLLAEVGGEVVRAPRREAGGAFVVDLMEMEVIGAKRGDDFIGFSLTAPDETAFSGLWKAVLDGRPICLRNFEEFYNVNKPNPLALTEAETANEETSEPGLVASNFFVSFAQAGRLEDPDGGLVEGIWLSGYLPDFGSGPGFMFMVFPADYTPPEPES